MSQSLLDEILACPSLPSLPVVAAKLLELTGDPDVSMSDIAALVQQDQALSAKVLKTVNSSFYGLTTPCGSIERAMGFLGLNTVKSVVLGFSLVETTKVFQNGFDLESHWRRAIIGATGARAVAKRVGGIDADEAFTAALFQDMGMLASFASMKNKYTDAIEGVTHGLICNSECEAFGFDHTEVGTQLAARWKLPEEICIAIRCHHDPDFVEPKYQSLARAVLIGAMLSEAMNPETATGSIIKIGQLMRDWYGEKAPDVGSLLEEVAEASHEIAKMFEQDIGEIPNPMELMVKAQEQGLEHQLAIQREAEELAKEATIDGLTRVSNRKFFDAELDRVYKLFQEDCVPFGVLFFDADKFKSVNDTLGHAAGDAVLIELAKRTVDAVGDVGIVCRYGGEEFAVIIPEAELDECAMLGELICSSIASETFDISAVEGMPNNLKVTVSVGVSATNAGLPTRVTSANKIVQEADECVYAAKDDGRNNVKVWSRFKKEKPATDQPSKEEVRPALSMNTPTTVSSTKNKTAGSATKILLVEDDALAATLVISLIKRRGKADIQWVKSGTKACMTLVSGKHVGENSFDLILCDLALPGCDGHEVLRVSQQTPETANVPFVLLTGSTDALVKDESLRRGVTQFIHKDDFCANVNKCLDEIFNGVSQKIAA